MKPLEWDLILSSNLKSNFYQYICQQVWFCRATHMRIHGHDDAKSSKIWMPTSLALKPLTTSLMKTKARTSCFSCLKQSK